MSPKYSVVIPTRNRAALTEIAVGTVLRQTFDDWELVLSDNSQNEDTRRMMARFDDPRIRYVRVEDLSMCDNWEHGCSHARGLYTLVLEDKQAFKYDALERIDAVVEDEAPEVVRWQWDSLVPYGLGHRVRRNGRRGDTHRASADEALGSLVHGSYMEAKHRLPIAHYSAVHRDVIERIRAGAVGRLFPPVSPDYTFALQILNFVDEVTYIDDGLVCFSDTSGSNGLSLRMKTPLGAEFAKSLGGDEAFFDAVPVKARTIEGSIYNDFINLQSRLGGRLGQHAPDWANYFAACHGAIRSSAELGVDMSAELAEWERALAEQEASVREEVARRVASQGARRASLTRRIRRSSLSQRVSRATKSLVNGRVLRRPDWRFEHILDYLEHEAQGR